MFNVNLDPLIQQIKEFNQNQVRTNQILTELLASQKEVNSQIKELLTKK